MSKDHVIIVNREDEIRESLEFSESTFPDRIDLSPENVENGLARLVLSIIELVRKLLERQALRRMDNETLSDEEIERIGEALMKLEAKMEELKEVFGLSGDDLNLSLGPINTIK